MVPEPPPVGRPPCGRAGWVVQGRHDVAAARRRLEHRRPPWPAPSAFGLLLPPAAVIFARLLALLLSLVTAVAAHAASKRTIAAQGDDAPGGGLFAGPGFRVPTGAGAGWIAFRAQVASADGKVAEQIVVQNALTRTRRTVVATGQPLPGIRGKVDQLLGRPAVNGHGDVAFVATVTLDRDAEQPRPGDPEPAGVFVTRGDDLEPVAIAGVDTGFGELDLATPVGVGAEDVNATDIAERTPALDDAGTVSFLASASLRGRLTPAVFVRAAGGALAVVVKGGDTWERGRFDVMGPPATSPSGILAFHALIAGDTDLDAIFVSTGGTLAPVVAAGFPVLIPDTDPPIVEDVSELGDLLAVNDAGDVAFTGGPLIDVSDSAALDADLVPGVFVRRAGAVTLLGWPGQRIGQFGRATDLALGTDFSDEPAPPALAPDGSVHFHAILNGGRMGVVVRASPAGADYDIDPVVVLGGSTPSSVPGGGTFLAAASGPAVDAVGGLAFTARVAGADTSEVLVYLPDDGEAVTVRPGDAAPRAGDGFFGGAPFFPPDLNDAGTIAFKSYVARGTGGMGIFRTRGDALEPVVRVGDVAPLSGARVVRFADLPGDPSLGANDDVAFSALLDDGRRGVFVGTAAGIRVVAVTDQDFPGDPRRPDAWVSAVAGNPAVDDAGRVVFRGTVEYPVPSGGLGATDKDGGLLASDAAGSRLLLAERFPSPAAELPYARFRDPAAAGSYVGFRALLGRETSQRRVTGLFRLGPDGVAVAAVEGQPTASGLTFDTLSGRPAVNAGGAMAFLGKVRGGGRAVLRRSAEGRIVPVAMVGERRATGGRIRSLGRPALASNGRLLFRTTYEPGTGGGRPALLLSSFEGDDPETYLVGDESAPRALGGRIASINLNASINRCDHVAFLAQLADAKARAGIFLASRAALDVERLRVALRPGGDDALAPKDRVRVRATLRPGTLGDGFVPAEEPVTVALSDKTRTLWTGRIGAGGLMGRGRVFRPRKGGRVQPEELSRVRLRVAADGSAHVAALSPALDLTDFGNTELEPPFTLRVEVGDDSATAVVPCTVKRGRVKCGRVAGRSVDCDAS